MTPPWWARVRDELLRIRYRLLLVNVLIVSVPIAGIGFARTYEREQLRALEDDMVHQGQVLREVLRDGAREVRERVHAAFAAEEGMAGMGISVSGVRVASVAPTKDLERALEAPMRERIQQEADEAAFARRALAVEKERAIQENELQNQIELARREEQLITQRGQNQ